MDYLPISPTHPYLTTRSQNHLQTSLPPPEFTTISWSHHHQPISPPLLDLTSTSIPYHHIQTSHHLQISRLPPNFTTISRLRLDCITSHRSHHRLSISPEHTITSDLPISPSPCDLSISLCTSLFMFWSHHLRISLPPNH